MKQMSAIQEIVLTSFDSSNIYDKANPMIMRLYDNYKNYQAQEKEMCKLKEETASELKELLDGFKPIEIDKQVLRCNNITAKRIDIKRLRKERPDICKEYSFESSYKKLDLGNSLF